MKNGLLTIFSVALIILNSHMIEPPSNELTRDPPELAQHFFYRWGSHRRKSAACPKLDMVWQYCSTIPVSTPQGPKLLLDVSTPQRPLLLLDMYAPQGPELPLDVSTPQRPLLSPDLSVQ